MKEIANPIDVYCKAWSTPLSDVLYQLERESHLKTLAPQMISGPLQGQFLRFISHMLQPTSCFRTRHLYRI